MFAILSIITTLAILIYLAVSAALVFHLKKYSIKGDKTKKMTWIFIGISIIFILGLLFILMGTPWETII